MSDDLFDKVNRTIFTKDQQERIRALEQNYQDDVAKFACMPDVELAAAAELYLKQCRPSGFVRGEPVYDAVMEHVIIPEMIRRLR